VFVTREEILRHAEADRRVLEATERYSARQPQWHGRLIRELRPYGDDSTSVGEAVRRTAADLGIDSAVRCFEAPAEVMVAAKEARGGRRRRGA
jgi:hypothetical protein